MEVDFVIEVYRLHDAVFWHRDIVLLYRFIPVGTTFNAFAREPDFVFKGRFRPGHSLGLDSAVRTYNLSLKIDRGDAYDLQSVMRKVLANEPETEDPDLFTTKE